MAAAAGHHGGLAAPFGGYGARVAVEGHHGHFAAAAPPAYTAPLLAGPTHGHVAAAPFVQTHGHLAGPAVQTGDYAKLSSVSGVAPGFPTLPRVVAAPPAFHQHSAGVVAANIAHHAAPHHAPLSHGHFTAAPLATHGLPSVTLPFETAIPTHGHLAAAPLVAGPAHGHVAAAPVVQTHGHLAAPVAAAPVISHTNFAAGPFHAPTHGHLTAAPAPLAHGHLAAPALATHGHVQTAVHAAPLAHGHFAAPAIASHGHLAAAPLISGPAHGHVAAAPVVQTHGHLAAPVAPAVQTGTYTKFHSVSGVAPGAPTTAVVSPIHAGIHHGPHAPLVANAHLAGPHGHHLNHGHHLAIPLAHPHGFAGHHMNLINTNLIK